LGLDSVELVFAIEAAFDVQVTDAEASQLRTLGDIHHLLVAKLTLAGAAVDKRALWEQLCQVIVENQGISRDKLVATAEIRRDLGLS
jgi:hypothetical protein